MMHGNRASSTCVLARSDFASHQGPSLEPFLVTDPKLAGILAELEKREPIFHRPEFGTTRRDFENMTDANFWEVGASGRRYSRKYAIDLLVERHLAPHEDIWETSGFHC